jgi:hypothetical protein
VKLLRIFTAIILLGVLAGPVRAIVVGQLDDFEDGTTSNWANGGAPGAPPVVNVDTGGPLGAGDNFMQMTALGGSGPGSFLTAFNRAQWLGDYVGLGVIAIEVDLQNFSKVDLNIRLGFKTDPGIDAPGYLSTPFSLVAGSGWQHAIFLINAGSLIPISGPADFNTFFSNGFGELRIINEAGASNLNGDPVAAQLGVDNIHAVPEPSSVSLLVAGVLAFGALRRRARRRFRQAL